MQKTSKPLIHDVTAARLSHYIQSPVQSLLLEGVKGSNYRETAIWLAHELAREHSIPLEYIHTVELGAKDSSIGIDAVGTILQSTKYHNDAIHGSVIIIHDANTMTTEAQNRLLKTLEEPSNRTFFILSVSSIDGILPTIRSRVTPIKLVNPAKSQFLEHLADIAQPAEIERAFMLHNGAFNAVHEQLTKSESEALANAKTILASKQFERLKLVDTYSKDRGACIELLEIMMRLFQTLIRSSATKNDIQGSRSYLVKLLLTEHALDNITKNSNIKLTLDALFLKI